MGKIKKYIEKIVDDGKTDDMVRLAEMLEELLFYLRENDRLMYKKYETELFGIACNYKFDEEMSKEIVEKMLPLGEFWNLNAIRNVKSQFNVPIDEVTLYLTMNSLANDYHQIIEPDKIETYVRMATAFINDEDAVPNKIWLYYTEIMKGD